MPAKPVTASLEAAVHVSGERPRDEVHATSLDTSTFSRRGERLAFLGVVADGVGGHAGGEEAARAAVSEIAGYVTSSLHCYYTNDPSQEAAFIAALEDGVLSAHRHVQAEAAGRGERGATTMTL
jgi:serine/threonine protein phosphatase PrpC